MVLKLHPEAIKDLQKATSYYKSISINLNNRFLDTIETTFDKILQYPNLYPFEMANVQKVVIQDFPYIILYEKYQDTIMILAIFNTHQNPQKLNNRLK